MTEFKDTARADELSRQRIVSDTGTNLFVEASAGSGKTTKLVERMTAMVGAGTDIRQICALTFTVNASREFYRRFREQLRKKSLDVTLTPEERGRYREALDNIDLCFLGTIDAFCHMILSEHPLEAGIPSDARLVEAADDMLPLWRRELASAADGEYGPDILAMYGRVTSAFRNADPKILSALPFYMRTRDTEHIYDPPGELDPDTAFAREKDYLQRLFAVLDGHPEYMNRGSEKARTVSDGIQRIRRLLSRSWSADLADTLREITALKDLRLSCPPENLGLEDIGMFIPHDAKRRWYDCVINEPGHAGSDLKEYQYSVFAEFMDAFSKECGLRLRRSGVMDFYDCQYCLLEMLRRDVRGDGRLIAHIRSRHSCFLVDEFQDTNPMQAEILFYLTSEHPVPDWRSCIPAPGSLFIVGDPKQSIYRFRNADVDSYMDVRSLFTGAAGETAGLYRNFRSSRTLCRKFNRIYTGMPPIPVDDGADEGVTGLFTYAGKTDPEQDAAAVAEIIKHITGNPSVCIYDRDMKGCRPVRFSDIMVITSAKKALGIYMSKCAEENIPCYVEGKTVFGECPAMLMTAAVMRCLAEPGNEMYRRGALEYGLGDCDFTRLEKLARTSSPSALFNAVISELPIFERAGTGHLEYVFFARELLLRGETDGTVTDAAGAAQYLQDLVGDAAGLERSLNLSGDPDCVHFANLHKVKGLEAPVVILANAKKDRSYTPSSRTEINGNERKTYLFSAEKDFIIFTDTKKYEEEKKREKAAQNAEKDRLLYVAGTRAGRILIVSDIGIDPFIQTWGVFIPKSDGDILSLGRRNTAVFPPRETMDIRDAGAKSVLDDRTVTEKTFALRKPSSLRVKSRDMQDEPDGQDAPDGPGAGGSGTDAALVGTMVHRLMEMIMSSRGKAEGAVGSVIADYDFDEDRKTEYTALLTGVADRILAGGYDRDIFSEVMAADEFFCEYPFCYEDGTDVFHGIMDLVYRKGDRWFIVDYKTNADPDDLDGKYRGQLDAYVAALEKIEGIRAEASTYHIRVHDGPVT